MFQGVIPGPPLKGEGQRTEGKGRGQNKEVRGDKIYLANNCVYVYV